MASVAESGLSVEFQEYIDSSSVKALLAPFSPFTFLNRNRTKHDKHRHREFMQIGTELIDLPAFPREV